MQTNTYFIKTTLGALALIAVLAPSGVFAANGQKAGNNFCTELPATRTKLLNTIVTQENKINTHQSDRLRTLDTRFTDKDTERTNNRIEKDTNVTKKVAALRTQYATDSTKLSAIAAFETGVQNALSTRRNAVDAAVLSFRNNVKNTVTTRQNTADSIVGTLKSDITSALDQAATSCAQGASPKTVKETFKNSVEIARQKAKTSRDGLAKTGVQVANFAQNRIDAVKQAESTFKTTMETLRTNIKTALGK